MNLKLKKVELKLGRFVARPLARKWPERPGSESPPSKESLNNWAGLTKNLGRFLDIGRATLWPHFFSMFQKLCFQCFIGGPRVRAAFWPEVLSYNLAQRRHLGGTLRGVLELIWRVVWGAIWRAA